MTYIFYIISLTVIFFNGIDSSLLFQSAFLDGKVYTDFQYFHFFLSLFGGFLFGFFITKKAVYQYTLSYILKISFLLSSVSIFIQYQRHHFLNRDFEQIIFDNTLCSIVLGLMSYSISRLLKDKNQLDFFKKEKFYWIIISILGFFYSQLITPKNLETAFLLNGLIYFLSYIFFLFYNPEKMNVFTEIKKEKLFSYIFSCIFILSVILLSNCLVSFTFMAEKSYMLYITMFFLIIESIRGKFHKVENVK